MNDALIGNVRGVPIDANGGVPVNIQDQVTPAVYAVFAMSIAGGDFGLASDTVASGTDMLVYQLDVLAGHGLNVDDEIILLDPISGRFLQAVVLLVAVNTITIDRPIDFAFPSSTTLGRRTVIDLVVDGSSDEKIFSVRAGSVPIDFYTYIFTMIHPAEPDDSKFGDISELNRGLILRIVDGYQTTICNIKKNGDFRRFGWDLVYSDKAGGGRFSTTAKINIKNTSGIANRISGTSVIQFIIQDDLDGLTSAGAVSIGHLTEGEV